jgi:hypothetical protein
MISISVLGLLLQALLLTVIRGDQWLSTFDKPCPPAKKVRVYKKKNKFATFAWNSMHKLCAPAYSWLSTRLSTGDLPWKTKKQRRSEDPLPVRIHIYHRLRIQQARERAISQRSRSYIPPRRWAHIAYDTAQDTAKQVFDKREKIQLARARHRKHRIFGFHANAMSSNTPHRQKARYMVFDSGSFPILVDNCASKSITNNLADFLHPPKKTNKVIQGVNGELTALKVGTITWRIQDDRGKTHILQLPNSYYAPSSPYRLLSPQH